MSKENSTENIKLVAEWTVTDGMTYSSNRIQSVEAPSVDVFLFAFEVALEEWIIESQEKAQKRLDLRQEFDRVKNKDEEKAMEVLKEISQIKTPDTFQAMGVNFDPSDFIHYDSKQKRLTEFPTVKTLDTWFKDNLKAGQK